MIYGHARVSTDAQDLTNQLAQLKAAGCDSIFPEKITGAHTDRPQLERLLRTAARGEVVIVTADPKDDLYIECALASGARTIITDDRHFRHPAVAVFGLSAIKAADFVSANYERKPK